jgi:hypothetical protein
MTKELRQLLIDCANFIQPYNDGGNEAERLMIRLDKALEEKVDVDMESNRDKVNLRTTNDVTFLYDVYEITEIVEYNQDTFKTPTLGKQYRARLDEIPELGLLIADRNLLGYRFIVNGKLIKERDTWEEYLMGVDRDDLVEWDRPYYDKAIEELNTK